jgi:hypothetical protein
MAVLENMLMVGIMGLTRKREGDYIVVGGGLS